MSKVEISMIQYLYFFNQIPFRGVARGGARGARASPEFGRSVNPIQTRGGGADYAPHITASPPDSRSYLHLCHS